MQQDSPYFRRNLAPANVKHALVDPSHMFKQSPTKRRSVDRYCLKGNREKSLMEMQSNSRETFDYDNKKIVQMPDFRAKHSKSVEKDPI